VEHKNGRRASERCFPKHLARLDHCLVQTAYREHARPEHSVLRVEKHDAKLFVRPRAEQRQQVRRRITRLQQLHPGLWRAGKRPPTELHRRHDLHGTDRPDTGDASELIASRSDQAMYPATRRQQLVRHGERIAAVAAVADHDGKQLVVSERRRAMSAQLLAGSVVGRQVSHRTTAAVAADHAVAARATYTDTMRACRSSCLVAMMALLTAVACGRPPDKEIEQARAAIETARTDGAERYAADELAAAREALDRASDAVAARDYQLALNHALDSRERAQNAAREATALAAAARADAERALATATATLATARTTIAAATRNKTTAARLTEAHDAVTALEQALQEAHAASDRQDWPATTAALEPATARLDAAIRDLAAPRTVPPARRRP
jgi:hypothetical protein